MVLNSIYVLIDEQVRLRRVTPREFKILRWSKLDRLPISFISNFIRRILLKARDYLNNCSAEIDVNIIVSYNVIIINVNGFICINNLMELFDYFDTNVMNCFNSKFLI